MQLVRRFLGLDRLAALRSAWTEINYCPSPRVGSARVLVACFIATLPILGYFLGEGVPRIDLVSVFVGIATVCGLVLRRSMGIPFEAVKSWGASLSLTHTAFALGCIPIAVIMFLFPESLVVLVQQRGEVVKDAVAPTVQWGKPMFIAIVSVWAGLTEEVIYRGLVLATVRRWSALTESRYRDAVAVVLSAALFAVVHIPVWGVTMSLAVFGLGCGFGVAFVVTGERLLPLIVYHTAFDALALTFASYIR